MVGALDALGNGRVSGLEFVEGHPLLFQVLRSEDKVACLGILFHDLALCLHLFQVLYQPVNAKCLLEDSDRLDVIGVIFGLHSNSNKSI